MNDFEICYLQYLGGMNPGDAFWRQCPELKEKWDREHPEEKSNETNDR